MIMYDDLDFLEFFDERKYLDKEAGIVEYTVTAKDDLSLNIYMNIYEDTVCFMLTSRENIDIVSFGLYNITSIKFDQNKVNMIKLLFYQEGKELPVVTALIKPAISLSLGLFTIK